MGSCLKNNTIRYLAEDVETKERFILCYMNGKLEAKQVSKKNHGLFHNSIKYPRKTLLIRHFIDTSINTDAELLEKWVRGDKMELLAKSRED
jgi:hypothetical protein